MPPAEEATAGDELAEVARDGGPSALCPPTQELTDAPATRAAAAKHPLDRSDLDILLDISPTLFHRNVVIVLHKETKAT